MRDHHDDLPYIVIERHSAGVAPFLWGVLIGAGIGLLLAPRSGEELQEELRERVRRVRGVAEDKIEIARSTVNRTRERLETGLESVRDRIDTVRERIESRADEARTAFESRTAGERSAGFRSGDGLAGDPMAASPRQHGEDIGPTDAEVPVERQPDLG